MHDDPVYVDELRPTVPTDHWPFTRGCHMVSNDLDALHAMAAQIGMQRKWFQDGKHPHYDLTINKRRQAIAAGAIETTAREWLSAHRPA